MSQPYTFEPALIDALSSGSDILCVSHVDPDGDAVGSLLGMGWILRALGKEPTLTLQDPVPVEHRVLPAATDVITSELDEYESAVRQHAFDTIICLDASSADRMGTAYNADLHESARLVVIDHHITNTFFGEVNWVEPGCAATCQMLVYLAGALNVPLEGPLAECLLTGMVTDTLGFRTSSTTAEVLGAAMQLMQMGTDLAEITQRTVNRRPFNIIRLWGRALPDVQLEDGVIWAAVTLDDIARTDSSAQDLGLSSFLVTADEADISAAFTERQYGDNQPVVECSFRSKPGFDVSQVAFTLGGGGHPAAAGCTVPGPLPSAVKSVVTLLKSARRDAIAETDGDSATRV